MTHIKRLALSGLCLALALLLPFLTGQVPQIGNMLCPMHIPVLLCGFVCGWQYGFLVGAIAPLFRNILFGMPPPFPSAFAMTFELAAYGLLAGLIYKKLSKTTKNLYISLIVSMVGGRIVWGVVMWITSMFVTTVEFGFSAFIAGAFSNAILGIILHIILIPIIILPLKKAGYMYND